MYDKIQIAKKITGFFLVAVFFVFGDAKRRESLRDTFDTQGLYIFFLGLKTCKTHLFFFFLFFFSIFLFPTLPLKIKEISFPYAYNINTNNITPNPNIIFKKNLITCFFFVLFCFVFVLFLNLSVIISRIGEPCTH